MDKLHKGRGVHWDIVLLSLCNSISGLFGGPWICAATVRAMSHLAALTVMSTTHAPGETPKIVDIKGKQCWVRAPNPEHRIAICCRA